MTKREQILGLVAAKKSTKEISALLGIPAATVRYYREKSKNQGQAATRITEHRRGLKRKAISYSGGCCLRCGYDRCAAALQFHHLDPAEKEFRLGSGRTWSWSKLKAEVDKTILICGNCHAELHDGLWQPDHRMVESQVNVRLAQNDG